MGLLTDGVRASMATWAPAGSDWDIKNQADAAMFEPIYQLVADQGSPDNPGSFVPGYGVLLDVDACPTAYLPFLGQFVGVYVPPGTDDATARALIRAEQGFQRGSGFGGSYNTSTASLPFPQNGGAIVAAAQRNLTGTQSVSLIERTAASGAQDAYHFILVVRPEEVVSVASLTAAVNIAKPGGVQWTLVQTDGWTVSLMEGGYATISLLEAAFVTVTGLENDHVGT